MTYKEYLENLVKTDSSENYVNSGPDHAREVFNVLFSNAKHKIKLFAGDLNGLISGSKEYQTGLDAFFRKGGELEILIQKYDDSKKPPLFDFLKFHTIASNAKITIKKTDSKLIKGDTNEEIHFCVADTKMFRMETNVTSYQALGSFNNTFEASKLIQLFDTIFNNSSSHPIPF